MKNSYYQILFLFLSIFAWALALSTSVEVGPLSSSSSPLSSDESYRVSCLIGKTVAGDLAPNTSRHYADLNKEESIAVTVCYTFSPRNTSAVYYGLDFLIPSGGVPNWCNNESGCKSEQSAPWNCGSDFADESCKRSNQFDTCGECYPRVGTLCCCRDKDCNGKFAAEFGAIVDVSDITNATDVTDISYYSTSNTDVASTDPSTTTSSSAPAYVRSTVRGKIGSKHPDRLYDNGNSDSDSDEDY